MSVKGTHTAKRAKFSLTRGLNEGKKPGSGEDGMSKRCLVIHQRLFTRNNDEVMN